jgi:hypothetical protein
MFLRSIWIGYVFQSMYSSAENSRPQNRGVIKEKLLLYRVSIIAVLLTYSTSKKVTGLTPTFFKSLKQEKSSFHWKMCEVYNPFI